MNFSDRYAYLLHVLVAERILSDPKSVIEKARSNVKKWIGQTEHANASIDPTLNGPIFSITIVLMKLGGSFFVQTTRAND